jgi:hypothetical protein
MDRSAGPPPGSPNPCSDVAHRLRAGADVGIPDLALLVLATQRDRRGRHGRLKLGSSVAPDSLSCAPRARAQRGLGKGYVWAYGEVSADPCLVFDPERPEFPFSIRMSAVPSMSSSRLSSLLSSRGTAGEPADRDEYSAVRAKPFSYSAELPYIADPHGRGVGFALDLDDFALPWISQAATTSRPPSREGGVERTERSRRLTRDLPILRRCLVCLRVQKSITGVTREKCEWGV